MIKTPKTLLAFVVVAGAAIGSSLAPSAAHAVLIGKHVNVAVGTVETDTFVAGVSSTVLVQDPGIEALGFGQILNVDFTDTGLRIDIVNLPEPQAIPPGIFVGFLASMFEGYLLEAVVSGNTNIVGFDTPSSDGQNRVIKGPQFIAFNFEGLSLVNGNFIEVGMRFIPIVPEPQPYALMLSGLGVLALLARRRRARAERS